MPIPAQLPVPEGRFVAAVSGGCDSVALLHLTFGQVIRVVHVHHELRGADSDADAEFVEGLCRRLGVAFTVVRRTTVAGHAQAGNPAQLRRMRLAVYRSVVADTGADGVLLGHHANDVAETVLLRLLRSRGNTLHGLSGLRLDVVVGGVRLVRPLLGVYRSELENYLREIGQTWREDASNRSPRSPRNRLRRLLGRKPGLLQAAIELGDAARRYVDALGDAARQVTGVGAVPTNDDSHAVEGASAWRVGDLSDLPSPLAEQVVRQRLRACLPHAQVEAHLVRCVLTWCSDAAGPQVLQLPGGWSARRRRGTVYLVRSPGDPACGA